MTSTEELLRQLDAPAEWSTPIDELVQQAPPLSPDQRSRLRDAFHGSTGRAVAA